MPKWNIIAFAPPPPSLSIETGVFVTAIDHSNVIFCLRFIWEKRSGLWSRWGRELLSQSCGLEAAGQTGNFKDGATQLFVFQHLCPYELGDLFGTPVTMEKCKWCLLGRESTRRGPRPHPSEDKAFASRATYAYEITSDYLAKGFLIDSGRCLADCAPMGRPPFSLRAQEEGRKNHLRDPPPHLLTRSSPEETHLPAKGRFGSNANSNTELTSGTAAKDDNLLPVLMIGFAICILANWELEWDQWVILHRSLYSGPEWNRWPRGESL